MATEARAGQGSETAAAALGELGIDDAQQMIDQTREVVGQALDQAAEFVRERPLVCLAGAVAIGYLVGKLASR